MRKVLMQAPKNGFFYVLDRATGELISADKYQDNATWTSGVDMKTGRPIEAANARYEKGPTPQAPGTFGNHNWHPMAFSPQTGLVYIPVHTIPTTFADAKNFKFRPGFWNTGTDFSALSLRPPEVPSLKLTGPSGQLVAWDPIARQARWVVPYPTAWNGGVLATAGGLVFEGALDGKFRAFDATTGKQVWEADADYPVLSGPISYEIAGEQYVAATAGWGTALPLAGGTGARLGAAVAGRVVVYKLNGTAARPMSNGVASNSVVEKPASAPFGDAAMVELGRVLYANNCTVCHGGGARSGGMIPDLRWSPVGATREAWKAVVIDGERSASGMAGFRGAMTDADAEAIRAYVVVRAQAAAAPPRGVEPK
jgi:quinohemoprotein ethanol dehydrogenase